MFHCSPDHEFDWHPFLLTSFKLSSTLLAGLPALLWVFVEMMIPGFQSAAFLVHLSWHCMAIRRAWLFNIFCVTIQLCQQLFVNFFRASFHVFNPVFQIVFLACAVLSSSLSNEMLLSCRIHNVCCLLLEYPRLFRREECLFLQVLCCFCILFLSR